MRSGANTIIDRNAGSALLTRAYSPMACALSPWWAIVILVALSSVVAGRAQSSPGTNGGSNSNQGVPRPQLGQQASNPFSNDEGYDLVIAERRLRALNSERQKQMVADTNKLLKLAKELNNEVAAANTSSLTPDQLHMIAEIEKLARSVRERMTGGATDVRTFLPTPVFANPVR